MKSQIGSGFALAWMAALGLIVVGFVGLDAWMGKPSATVPTTATHVAAETPANSSSPSMTEETSVTAAPSSPVVPPSPTQTSPSVEVATTTTHNAVTVPDLDRLASAVHLREPSVGVSKQVWASQLPVAESLLQGPCDCEERNWLKHYVEAANDALSGSPDYAQAVQLLATLRRSDQDPIQISQASR